MLQVSEGSDRNHWAHELGWLVISMNEIDWMISNTYSTLFRGAVDGKWLERTSADRLSHVAEKMRSAPRSPASEEWGSLLDRVTPLMEMRNHIAHGALAVGGASINEPIGNGFVMFRYHKKTKQFRAISLIDLRGEVANAKTLSNDFADFVALCVTNPDFVRPYQAGESF